MRLPLSAHSGVVSSCDVLTLEAFAERLDVGEQWLRSARRHGLRVAYFGRKGFICGDDFREFIRQVADARKESVDERQ